MRLSALALLFIVAAPVVISASNEEELIQSLPGADFELNFKHYSGFLQASDTHFLHYWFVESQGNPQKDPLLFWFNGGPGCSSLDGLLNEMGPYLVNPDGKTLRQNPYSWNKFASVVYIESPAGVGFSYSTDGNTTTDDDQTSLESYNAIKQFFGKFPEFRDRPTFITGESYGGVYVPTLTARIIDGQEDFKINLKGVAIGNGYVNADLNVDTSARFAYGHGLVDEMTWNMLEVECCRGCIDGCDLSALTGHCNQVVQDIFTFIWSGGLNPYDIYRECEPNPDLNGLRKRVLDRAVLPSALFSRLYDNSTLTINTLKKKDNDKKKKNKTDRVHHHHHHQEQKLNWPLLGSGSVPCLNDTDVTAYINSAEVRDALHIPDHLGRWTICSDEISTNYIKVYGDMAPFVKKILKARVRILLYYGDTDMACNFLLGQQFSARLGLKRLLNKQIWKYNKQIAGFKTMYSRGLTYLTVRGAGHMAPQWRAPEMDYAISQFLLNHNI